MSTVQRKGLISGSMIGLVAVVLIALMTAIPVTFLKIHITNSVKIEYKHTNADLVLMNLLSHPDIIRDTNLYISGLESNELSSTGNFNREDFETKVEEVLDKMVSSGCYKLYYKTDRLSEEIIIDKSEQQIEGEICYPQYLGRTYVTPSYDHPPVKLILEIT